MNGERNSIIEKYLKGYFIIKNIQFLLKILNCDFKNQTKNFFMTKESRHFKKSSEDLFQNILLVNIILLFLSYFITSCNSSNDPSDHSESIDTAATSSDTANRTSEKNLNTNLDILYLTEEEYL